MTSTDPTRPRRVTLADVARQAGVSVSTASAVLGNRPHCYASADTKQQVFEAARRVGYRPNILARGLRGERTHTIGLVMYGIDTGPVSGAMLQSIEDAAWRQDYRLLIGTHKDDRQRLRSYVDEFLGRGVDGLIFMPTDPDDGQIIAEARQQGAAVVTVEAPADYDAPDVSVDRELGGYYQIKHLFGIGRIRPAFIFTSHLNHTGQAKVDGIRRALAEHGHALSDFPVVENPRPRGIGATGAELTQQLLSQDAVFDSIVTLSDHVALSVITALTRAGKAVPDDVAVIGFDDCFEPQVMMIPLTTIRQPRDIGTAVFEQLIAQIEPGGKTVDPHARIRLQPTLIIRESTVKGAGLAC